MKKTVGLVVGLLGMTLAAGCESSSPPLSRDGGASVAWHTSTVALTATDFWIVANGQRYTSSGASVNVNSDPGDATYTTLELTWMERGQEMRFFTYFYAPDTTGWFSNEMRTYNGQPSVDWLFYSGTFFKSAIGTSFHGNIDLRNDASDPIQGELHLHGLTLSTTLTGVCPGGGCLGS
jgi:hypothetical protein